MQNSPLPMPVYESYHVPWTPRPHLGPACKKEQIILQTYSLINICKKQLKHNQELVKTVLNLRLGGDQNAITTIIAQTDVVYNNPIKGQNFCQLSSQCWAQKTYVIKNMWWCPWAGNQQECRDGNDIYEQWKYLPPCTIFASKGNIPIKGQNFCQPGSQCWAPCFAGESGLTHIPIAFQTKSKALHCLPLKEQRKSNYFKQTFQSCQPLAMQNIDLVQVLGEKILKKSSPGVATIVTNGDSLLHWGMSQAMTSSKSNCVSAAATTYLAGLSYWHKIYGFHDFSKSFINKKLIEGLNRQKGVH